jgi:succinate dehydrogenase / fumarate reductase, cytochrome b subunit
MEDRAILGHPAQAPEKDVDRNVPFGWALSSLAGGYVMAVTGLVLVLFVLAHLAGNLLIFGGRDALNSYAHGLEEHPALLWAARAVLLLVFGIHVATGLLLTLQNRAARPIRHVCWKPQQSSWAARHMFLTGLLVLAFVIYHLLHFTFGVTDPGHFKYAIPSDPRGRHDVAGMVVGSRRAWSWFQHLGWNRENPLKPWGWFPPVWSGRRGYARLVHGFGFVVVVSVVLSNCSIPLAIQLGWRPNGLHERPALHRLPGKVGLLP